MNEIIAVVTEYEITSGVTVLEVAIFAIIIIASLIFARVLTQKVRHSLPDRIPKNDREVISKALYFIVAGIGVIIALPYINVNLSGLFVAGGVFAIIIGFAGQNVFSNFIAGLILFVERPIKIGDNIGIEDVLGTVEDIRILSTIIKTYDGIYTRIPNFTIFTANITNHVAHVARRFEYNVGIRYQDDADLAMSVIRSVVEEHPFALKSPAPKIYVDELGDNAVIISVRIWAPSMVWWDVRTNLLWKIKVALEKSGIEIPFPQRTVWFPEGKTTIQTGMGDATGIMDTEMNRQP